MNLILKGDYMKNKDTKLNLLLSMVSTRVGRGAVCQHIKMYRGKAILNVIKYDDDNCICKSCGKIIPTDIAINIRKCLEDSK